MISYVRTVVVACRSSVGGSPIVATLRTPPARGFSWAPAPDTSIASTTAASASVFFMEGALSERGGDDAAGGLDEPALARERGAVERGRHPVGHEALREGAEVRRGHVADGVPRILIDDQALRSAEGLHQALRVDQRRELVELA